MNTKLHAVTDTSVRPIRFFITAGQVSDYTDAMALLSSLPDADWLLADRGYDADWFREALANKGTKPCIPGTNPATRSSGTINAVTDAATVSNACLAGSKTGDASQPAIVAPRSSCRQSLSPQSSYFGHEP
jgi:hypothetical protein